MDIPNHIRCAYDEMEQALVVENVGTASPKGRSTRTDVHIWRAVCGDDAMAIRVVIV